MKLDFDISNDNLLERAREAGARDGRAFGRTATLELDGQVIELTHDAHGLVGRAVIDGVPVTVHATITSTGTRSVSPAKWVAARG